MGIPYSEDKFRDVAAPTTYLCEGCGDLLRGRQKGVFVQRDYIQVKGTMLLQLAGTSTKESEHVFMTKAPGECLSFCLKEGFPCLRSFVDNQRGRYNFYKTSRLRNQAGHEDHERTPRRNTSGYYGGRGE